MREGLDIERLMRGGCYERKKQRGKGKQESAAEKPEREEKDEEGEERRLGAHLENHSWTSLERKNWGQAIVIKYW
jgi:hypothetical protein